MIWVLRVSAPRAIRKLAAISTSTGARSTRQIEMPLVLMTVSSCRSLRSTRPRMAPMSTVTGRVLMVQRTALIATITMAMCSPRCSATKLKRQVSSDSTSAISP
ncbi:hypothetical protein D3C87_1581110 [compost metagenome]